MTISTNELRLAAVRSSRITLIKSVNEALSKS